MRKRTLEDDAGKERDAEVMQEGEEEEEDDDFEGDEDEESVEESDEDDDMDEGVGRFIRPVRIVRFNAQNVNMPQKAAEFVQCDEDDAFMKDFEAMVAQDRSVRPSPFLSFRIYSG